MYCSNCGNFVEDAKTVCPSCGAEILKRNLRKTKKTSPWVWILIISVFVVIAGFLGFLGYTYSLGSNMANQILSSRRMNKEENRIDASEKNDVDTYKQEAEKPILSIMLLNKGFHKAEYTSIDDVQDQITFSFQFLNNSDKDIRSFIGEVKFLDLFGNEIMQTNLRFDDPIFAGDVGIYRGGIEYNPFFKHHTELRSLDQDDILVGFHAQKVIFLDGTEQHFETE